MAFICGPNPDEIAQRLMDEKVEKLISERLLVGWVLYTDGHCASCPKCNVPLMINQSVREVLPAGAVVAQPTEFSARAIAYDERLAEEMYAKKVAISGKEELPDGVEAMNHRTVAGVPYCVYCQCHVVTEVSHLSLVEAFDRLADRQIKGNMIFHLPKDATIPEKIQACRPLEVNSLVASGPGLYYRSSPIRQRGKMSENLKFLTGESHADVNMEHRGIFAVPSEMPSEMGIEAAPTANTLADHYGQVEENPSMSESVAEEYNVRRDIATKVLGAKMLQGYALKESQCAKCGMPQMEHHGKIECVVCPILIKRAKQKKNTEEATRLARLREEAEATERILNNELKFLEDSLANRSLDDAELKAAQDATDAARELLVLAELRAVAAARKEQDERHAYAQDAAYLFTPAAPQSMSYWKILRDDASSQLSRRMMQGWVMTSNHCEGVQCQQAPLLSSRSGQIFCVVCGGSGNGEDGAYKSIQVAPSDDYTVATFDDDTVVARRNEATALIGQKLMTGAYAIANQKCDQCSIPLMTDIMNGGLECVVCGPYKEDPTMKLGMLVLQGWEAVANIKCTDCSLPLLKNPSTRAVECISCGPVARELTRTQRDIATAEIGKRILSGWSVLPERSKCVFCNFSLVGGFQNNCPVIECVACGRNYNDTYDVPHDNHDMFHHPSTPRVNYTPGSVNSGSMHQSHSGYAIDEKFSQGWSLLNNGQALCECGSPLMRPPNSRGEALCVNYNCANSCHNAQYQLPMSGRMQRTGRPPRTSNGRAPVNYISHPSDDVSLLNDEVSVAKSVASDALGAILSRIEAAKAELEQSTSETDQTKIVELIEKLAGAAMAVKNLEDSLD